MKTVLYFRLQWRLCQRYTSGVYRYAKKAGWLVQPIDAGRNTPMARQAIKGWRADGCIVDWLFMDRMGWSPDVFGDLPTVFIDVSRMEQYRLCPSVDYDAVGCVRMVMAELLALGYEDNAYVGMIADRELQGRNRLTAEDVKYLAGTLGIRSDLDLRSIKETADLAESPLGQGIVFVQNQSACYTGIFRDDGKKAMAANFRHFCDRRNYPVIMHCIGWADRTGALAYVLNGVLGVARHDLEVDWESTFYPNIPDANPDPHYWCRKSHFNDGFSKYGKEGDSWNRRIELYLLDCGVTEAEIATFRDIMLESDGQ